DLALHVHRDLLVEVPARHGRRHLGDVPDLGGEVLRHRVDVVGQVLPGTRDTGDFRLATQLPFGADLTGHAGHFRGERAELVHHRVDRVLELEDFALHVDGDLLGEIALGHRGGDLGDVPDLGRQVARHRVDVVGEVLPRAGHALHP